MTTCHQRAVMGLICIGMSCAGLALCAPTSAEAQQAKKKTVVRTAEPDERDARDTRNARDDRDNQDDAEERPAPRVQRTGGVTQKGTNANSNTNSGDRIPRPQAQPFRVEEVSPELNKILKEWEKKSADIKRLEGEFQKYTYDETFEVEKRAKGTFVFAAPDKGVYTLKGLDAKNAKSRRLKTDGSPYDVQADAAVHWVCDGIDILNINHAAKTFERISIPAEDRGQNIVNGPLPFLFGMKADQAKRRYKMVLEKQTSSEIWISAKPLWAQDSQNYQKAVIILNPKTYLPRAVQLIDPAGTTSTTHIFGEMDVNSTALFKIAIPGTDPFKPNLKAYKQVQSDKNAQPVAQPGTQPKKPNSTSVQPAGGTQPKKPAVNNAAGTTRTRKS